METATALEPIQRLSRDLKQAATTLSDDEARYLKDVISKKVRITVEEI